MKTIAQQLNVTEFPFEIKNSQGKIIYFEKSNGYWHKSEYNSQRNVSYFEKSNGYWHKKEYNSQGKVIYSKDYGTVNGDMNKEVTLKEVAAGSYFVNLTVNGEVKSSKFIVE